VNASTFQARAMVTALVKHGVKHVVLAPGSRNSPLSIALAQAAASVSAPIALYVRIDERTAAFTALGIAKRLNQPVAVVCTSGTAAAHLYAAVYEAHEAGVPLILITADRPVDVRGRGANQTIDQVAMFGSPIRADWDLPLAIDQDSVYWELSIAQAVLMSVGDEYTSPGPVHLNIPFAEPLVPDDGDPSWADALESGDGMTAARSEDVSLADLLEDMHVSVDGPRGVVIISDPHSAREAVEFARLLRWPVLAEPGSMARVSDVGVQHYARLLQDTAFAEKHRPEIVITAGRFGLSRAVAAYVKTSVHHIAVGRFPLDADPFATAEHHIARMPLPIGVQPTDDAWLLSWQEADSQFESHLDEGFTSRSAIAALMSQLHPRDLLWVAASMSVRDVDDLAPLSTSPMMLVNRGANGIDGLIAAASGAALVHGQRAFAVMGDIAFLHDSSSLVIPTTEVRPPLSIVVLNNHEGAIFRGLEQGAAHFASVFDRIYATPQQVDIESVARSMGWTACTVRNNQELVAALEAGTGVIVAEVV